MAEAGFFEQKQVRPGSFAAVVALHVAALAAVILIKAPDIIPATFPPTKIIFIPDPVDPPEIQKVQPQRQAPRQQPTFIDLTQSRTNNVTEDIAVDRGRVEQGPPVWNPPGPETLPPLREETPPPPVRTEAEFDPRYGGDLQSPYPASEQRAQREGIVRLRVTIGADGRVKAVEKLSATSDAFWRASERHARARWRFRPATLDGRPVESRKVLSLTFRLQDA